MQVLKCLAFFRMILWNFISKTETYNKSLNNLYTTPQVRALASHFPVWKKVTTNRVDKNNAFFKTKNHAFLKRSTLKLKQLYPTHLKNLRNPRHQQQLLYLHPILNPTNVSLNLQPLQIRLLVPRVGWEMGGLKRSILKLQDTNSNCYTYT